MSAEANWVAAVLALPVLGVAFWCAILWQRLGRFGISPLLFGTAAAIAVQFGLAMLGAWTSYTAQAEAGLLPMALRDDVVPGWAWRDFLADLPFVLAWLLLGAGPALALVIQGSMMVKYLAGGFVAIVAALAIINPGLALIDNPIDMLVIGAAFLIGGCLTLLVRLYLQRGHETERPA